MLLYYVARVPLAGDDRADEHNIPHNDIIHIMYTRLYFTKYLTLNIVHFLHIVFFICVMMISIVPFDRIIQVRLKKKKGIIQTR